MRILNNYIEKPPYTCKLCSLSAERVISKNGKWRERFLYCFLDRVYCQPNEPKIVDENQEGCTSEVFLKKLLELI